MSANQYPDGVTNAQLIAEIQAAVPGDEPLHTYIEYLDKDGVKKLDILSLVRKARDGSLPSDNLPDVLVLNAVPIIL